MFKLEPRNGKFREEGRQGLSMNPEFVAGGIVDELTHMTRVVGVLSAAMITTCLNASDGGNRDESAEKSRGLCVDVE